MPPDPHLDAYLATLTDEELFVVQRVLAMSNGDDGMALAYLTVEIYHIRRQTRSAWRKFFDRLLYFLCGVLGLVTSNAHVFPK